MFGPFKKKQEEEKKEQAPETPHTQENQEQEYQESYEQSANAALEAYQQCQSELASVKDQLVRIGADFQNFKKRTERDKLMWSQTLSADIFLGLLPVIDNFDRALEQAKKSDNHQDLASWITGFELIYKSLNDFLKKNKVEPIEQMEKFDPTLHEALMQVEDADKESGTIIQVFERGFMMDGKVLRPAKVSVSK